MSRRIPGNNALFFASFFFVCRLSYDGTGGEQPRGTEITRNYAHEVGIQQLQSSMWFQSKTAKTHLAGNVFINGPRAGASDPGSVGCVPNTFAADAGCVESCVAMNAGVSCCGAPKNDAAVAVPACVLG